MALKILALIVAIIIGILVIFGAVALAFVGACLLEDQEKEKNKNNNNSSE